MTKSKVSRRDFMKGAATATGAAAVLALTGCAQSEGTSTSRGTGSGEFDKETDVLIVGGGLGGLVTAATVSEGGAKVTLIEISTRLGSTALMCSGIITPNSAYTFDDMMAVAPLTDPILAQTYVDALPNLVDWLASIDAPFVEFPYGEGSVAYRMGGEAAPEGNIIFTDFLEEYATSNGVEILLQTAAKSLITDDKGSVIGVIASTADGGILRIGAKEVVLACGGNQNNSEVLTRYISRYADLMVSRGNPHDAGIGMSMARNAGAAFSRSQGTFYGHPVPFPLQVTQSRKDWDEGIVDDDWIKTTTEIFTACQNSGFEYGVVTNLAGERFFDESKGSLLLNQAIASQKFSRAFFVIDSAIRADHTAKSAVSGTEYLDLIEKWGGDLYQADTLEELADKLAAVGVHKSNFLDTVNSYNKAVDAGSTAAMNIPKANTEKAAKLVTGPFYAFTVVSGNSFTFGGVQVDTLGHALDDNDQIIPGLWAVPGTAGGLQYDMFVGILCSVLTMSHHAGTALRDALDV